MRNEAYAVLDPRHRWVDVHLVALLGHGRGASQDDLVLSQSLVMVTEAFVASDGFHWPSRWLVHGSVSYLGRPAGMNPPEPLPLIH